MEKWRSAKRCEYFLTQQGLFDLLQLVMKYTFRQVGPNGLALASEIGGLIITVTKNIKIKDNESYKKL